MSDIVELLDSITRLFGVISPIIILWMRAKWKLDKQELEVYEKCLHDINDQGYEDLNNIIQNNIENNKRAFNKFNGKRN